MVNECTEGKPLSIYLVPGQTITIWCPVHKEGHKVTGGGTLLATRSQPDEQA